MDEVEYEYQGRVWRFPPHLARLQIAIAEADADCRRAEDPGRCEAARAERLRLVVEKFALARSWWDTFEKHERWEADWALQDYARSAMGRGLPAAGPGLSEVVGPAEPAG